MTEINLSIIEKMVYIIRGQKVMLDSDLADLYEVETRVFNQAVKRNKERFPQDFMFQLDPSETEEINRLFGVKNKHGGHRKMPFAFTENGVAMLASVLNSSRAISVNIAIMRTFTKLRSFLVMENDMNSRLSKLEEGTNKLFKVIFQRLDDIDDNIKPNLKPGRNKIGLNKE